MCIVGRVLVFSMRDELEVDNEFRRVGKKRSITGCGYQRIDEYSESSYMTCWPESQEKNLTTEMWKKNIYIHNFWAQTWTRPEGSEKWRTRALILKGQYFDTVGQGYPKRQNALFAFASSSTSLPVLIRFSFFFFPFYQQPVLLTSIFHLRSCLTDAAFIRHILALLSTNLTLYHTYNSSPVSPPSSLAINHLSLSAANIARIRLSSPWLKRSPLTVTTFSTAYLVFMRHGKPTSARAMPFLGMQGL